jgi:hypothetical protein
VEATHNSQALGNGETYEEVSAITSAALPLISNEDAGGAEDPASRDESCGSPYTRLPLPCATPLAFCI